MGSTYLSNFDGSLRPSISALVFSQAWDVFGPRKFWYQGTIKYNQNERCESGLVEEGNGWLPSVTRRLGIVCILF